MSGIVGLFCRNGKPVDNARLEQMIAMLAHRGPDGSGKWRHGSVGLGHLTLYTTPESLQESLPLVSPSGHFSLTADARIDNRPDLIRMLRLTQQPAHEITDSQLILAAYERWGEDCPAHLVGDFAFAIWDDYRQQLFCARDHMGIKPFYYHQASNFFACASEMKALLALPEATRRLNEVRVLEHLITLNPDRTRTFYQDVRRLLPGHRLIVTRETLRIEAYWTLEPERDVRLGSDEAYAEQFRDLFTEAVSCRLRSVYPVGSVLSGGLDSASVTCVARDISSADARPPLHTLSAFFTGSGDTDERPFIDDILAQGDLLSHRIDGNNIDLCTSHLRQLLWHVEEPFQYGFLLVLWALYGVARERGIRVLLDGTDGDSTVADCRQVYFPELFRTGRWWTFAAEIDGFAQNFNPTRPRSLHSRLGGFMRFGIEPAIRAPMQWAWNRVRTQEQHHEWLHLINPDLVQRVKVAPHVTRTGGSWLQARTARQAHYGRLTSGIILFNLEMLNKAAAAFSLEYRHPFFDKRLVEFCLALPVEQKISRGQTRVVMRRALAPVLPHSICHRPGKGRVSHHYVQSLLSSGPEPLAEIISNNAEPLQTYLNMMDIQKLHHRYMHLGQENVVKVWYATILALWLLQVVEGSANQSLD